MPDNPFVGTWKLISCDALRRNGRVVPLYGKSPEGRLYYDAEGNMSVHIMRSGRPCFRSSSKFRAAPEEMRMAYDGYEAYFSTYEVDAEECLIKHRVIGGLFPNWTGTIQSRFFRFEGSNQLILSTAPVGVRQSGGTIVTLVWERLTSPGRSLVTDNRQASAAN